MLANPTINEDLTSPIEIHDAVPDSVRHFAQQLVDRRQLDRGFELAPIPLGSSGPELGDQAELDQITHLPGAQDWRDWSVEWLTRFGQQNQAHALSLRLSHSRRPTCPRFHIDDVRMRWIATLLGPGTQWLPSPHVVRLDDGSIAQSPDPDHIQQLAVGSVGLFMGASFDASAGSGVVHRSPPDCVDRIVMTVDLVA